MATPDQAAPGLAGDVLHIRRELASQDAVSALDRVALALVQAGVCSQGALLGAVRRESQLLARAHEVLASKYRR